MRQKLAITILVSTLALLYLIYAMYGIVHAKSEEYERIVLTQHATYDSRTLPYKRGAITDRNGTYLAVSQKVYNLILDAKVMCLETKTSDGQAKRLYLEAALDALEGAFGYDKEEVRSLVLGMTNSSYYRYAMRLSEEDKLRFEEASAAVNQARIDANTDERVKGVWFEEDYKRVYPQNSLASLLVGFTNADGVEGTTGIELYYDDTLVGTNGREYGYLADETNVEKVIKSPVNGSSVVLTIDANIQKIVEKHVNRWMDEMGSENIGVIVMDPNNGEILAMATQNQFDLNDPRNLTGYYTQEEIIALGEGRALTANPDKDVSEYTAQEIYSLGEEVARNKLWRNFAISDTFEPGSPAKVFTVSAALEEAAVSSESHFLCDGHQQVGDYDIKCTAYAKGGHGDIGLMDTLTLSCNDAIMQIASKEGKDTFLKYQRLFGFGVPTGIDLPGEPDGAFFAKMVYHEDNMYATDLATNAFGQNFNCTMLQMASAFCSVINGGLYYQPHVAKQILNDQGTLVREFSPLLVRETVSPETSAYLRETLLATVETGTGKAAAVEGYRVGGKTGTAEKYPREDKNYLLSFAGFAPYDDPAIVVYVVIDVPHTDDQAHSTYASELFSKITKETLPYLNIFPGDGYTVQDILADIAAQDLAAAEAQALADGGAAGAGGASGQAAGAGAGTAGSGTTGSGTTGSGTAGSAGSGAGVSGANGSGSGTGSGGAGSSGSAGASGSGASAGGTSSASQTKPAQTKAAETKAAETKAAETKAAETKAAETKAAQTKAAETKAAETKTEETKPPETNPPQGQGTGDVEQAPPQGGDRGGAGNTEGGQGISGDGVTEVNATGNTSPAASALTQVVAYVPPLNLGGASGGSQAP
ncbi:MAG: penicillin-binding protein 2 [Lachnospiraceae bacterium]|jgi:stage V sporulation protein D (sporulation-specific penicillin-binding protein)|nr:penicillin-binding protein 2 [Lachnospiraceae bacterium]